VCRARAWVDDVRDRDLEVRVISSERNIASVKRLNANHVVELPSQRYQRMIVT
jgi:hypothetical protein